MGKFLAVVGGLLLAVVVYPALICAVLAMVASPVILVRSMMAPGRPWWSRASERSFTSSDRQALFAPAIFLSLPGLLGGVPLLLLGGTGIILLVGSGCVWAAAFRLRRGDSRTGCARAADLYARLIGVVWVGVLVVFVIRMEMTIEGFLWWLALGPWFVVSVLCGRQLRLAAEALEREVAAERKSAATSEVGAQ